VKAFLYVIEGLFASGSGLYLMVLDFEEGADIAQHSRFVVHQ
jgi:anti-sigma factor ChrR (cupin superfamily)